MDDVEKQMWPTFKDQLEQYRNLRDNIIKLVDDGNFDEAVKQYKDIPKLRDAMFNSLDKLISKNLSNAKTLNSDNHSIYLNRNINNNRNINCYWTWINYIKGYKCPFIKNKSFG